MSLNELAQKVVDANKDGSVAALLDAHYSPDAVSVEAFAMDPSAGREAKGLDAIRGKHIWWESAMEVNNFEIEGPYLHGDDRFALVYTVDATTKATGERNAMKEVAVYHVADGKIVREEFFYTK